MIQSARRIAPIDYQGVPAKFKGKLSAVCRTAAECDELVHWFGSPDFCPNLPVMVMVPGAQPTLIPGFGYATAAELRDCAVVTWYEQTERLAKTGRVFDFDALRERRSLMRREEVDSAVREAMLRRIEQHKANPVTDPFRQPVYPNPTNRKVYERK
ncbi:hypothetical protein LCGC14_0859330 [marine sediment metagenome]|uniref:Uncharacterized protein n=1 Tax=marine sediment metagenome TaxID=412755 RepID=A0A0F9SEX8_9ZZZZ